MPQSVSRWAVPSEPDRPPLVPPWWQLFALLALVLTVLTVLFLREQWPARHEPVETGMVEYVLITEKDGCGRDGDRAQITITADEPRPGLPELFTAEGCTADVETGWPVEFKRYGSQHEKLLLHPTFPVRRMAYHPRRWRNHSRVRGLSMGHAAEAQTVDPEEPFKPTPRTLFAEA